MIEKLISIGLTEKEAKVYLYILEYGLSGASEIARHLSYPKSTVNFLAESLWKKGLVSKSIRTHTHYYEVHISALERFLEEEKLKHETFLHDTIPLLSRMQQASPAKPKITFFDGLEHCRSAYLGLLRSGERFYEFGNHGDLEKAFGEKFMTDFIRARVERRIFCEAIATTHDIEQRLHESDKKELRNLSLFSRDFGKISSSIALYQDKVLTLNLEDPYVGVQIENRAFAETLKTIFLICRR